MDEEKTKQNERKEKTLFSRLPRLYRMRRSHRVNH